ncbi:MAG TPA: serine esterase, partial [Verrucomicrobiae bacterium]|nr:serine esterase [Verrucomicrobiae bacterium]
MLQSELIQSATAGSRDLLIALHGLGDSMAGYRFLPEVLRIPELNVLLVNAPDGYYGGFSWYDFATDPGPGVERSFRLLESLFNDLEAKGFPADRTILFGFSQGCLMSIETGLRYSRRLAGVIGVSGYVHEPDRLLGIKSTVATEQEFLLTHGTRDTLIPLEPVRAQIDQLKRAGIRIEFHEF